MTKPMLCVDLNEVLEPNLVLLSATDTKAAWKGEVVSLHDGLEVSVHMDDTDENGHPDDLVATGVAEVNQPRDGAHM